MSWNDGYERKKFERKQVGQAKRFKDLGMTDEQIQEIYALDLREYRNNRIFSIHTQSIDSLENDESRNGLYKKFVTSTTCSMDMSECSRFEWIEEIENSMLYLAISKLAVQQKELLTLLYIDGYSHISSFAYAADAQVFITTIQHIGLKGQRSFRTNCICVIFAISDMD